MKRRTTDELQVIWIWKGMQTNEWNQQENISGHGRTIRGRQPLFPDADFGCSEKGGHTGKNESGCDAEIISSLRGGRMESDCFPLLGRQSVDDRGCGGV